MDIFVGIAVLLAFSALVAFCVRVGEKTSTDVLAIVAGLILMVVGGLEMAGAIRNHGYAWHMAFGLGLIGLGIVERSPRRFTRLLALTGLVIAALDLWVNPSHGQGLVAFFLTTCVVAGISNDEAWAIRVGVFNALISVMLAIEYGRRDQPWWGVGFGLALAWLGVAARDVHRRPLVRWLATLLVVICAVLVGVDLASGLWLPKDVLPKTLSDELLLTLMVAASLRRLDDAPVSSLAAVPETSTIV